LTVALALLTLASVAAGTLAQSGKGTNAGRRIITLNVIAHAPEGTQVTKEDFDLYDGGAAQEIESFGRLDSGSRLILLVDSSANLKVEAAALQKAMEAIIDELYQDDQMMVVGYSETAEILEDMTPDLAKLQATPAKIIRKGSPSLFDALIAVADAFSNQASSGIEKRAIILISDGHDAEAGTAAYHPDRIAKVLPQLIEPDGDSDGARVFFDNRDAAELPASRITRGLRRHSTIDVLLRIAFEVIADLVV